MKNIFLKKQGFALLYSILISGVIALIGILLVNIITRQLIFSSLSRDSEISYYYLANSGRECLEYNLSTNQSSFYRKVMISPPGDLVTTYRVDHSPGPIQISCFATDDVSLTLDPNSPPDKPAYFVTGMVVHEGAVTRYVDLKVQFNESCILGACSGDSLLDKSRGVITVSGYNQISGPYATKRTAVSVFR